MSFKPAKSRSEDRALKKVRRFEKLYLSIDKIQTPIILEQPIKSLGKIFDAALRDKAAIKSTVGTVSNGDF